MSGIEVRIRQASDMDATLEAMEDVYATDGYPEHGTETGREFLQPPNEICTWIALRGTRVIGHIMLLRLTEHEDEAKRAWAARGGDVERTVYLARLFVRKSDRKDGLAQSLMGICEAWAREHGYRIVLMTFLRSTQAIALYNRLGYQTIGQGTFTDMRGRIWPTQYMADGQGDTTTETKTM